MHTSALFKDSMSRKQCKKKCESHYGNLMEHKPITPIQPALFTLRRSLQKKRHLGTAFQPTHVFPTSGHPSGPASRHFRSQLRISSALALFNSKCFFAAAPGSWRSKPETSVGLGDVVFCWGGNPSKRVQHSEKFEIFSMCCFFFSVRRR